MDSVHVFYNINDNMFLPACVCTYTLLHYAQNDTQYVLHILHGKDFSEKKRDDFLTFFSCYDNILIVYTELREDLSHIPTIREFSEITYYRLYAYKYFIDLKKIIYLDVDLCVKCDLSNLYNTRITNEWYIAGVKSCYTPKDKSKVIKIGADPNTYVNSGVLLFNLDAMRDGIYEEKLNQCIRVVYPDLDQDIINICAKGKTLNISIKYNVTPQLYNGILGKNTYYSGIEESESIGNFNDCIVHYNGPKPWNVSCVRDDIWWCEFRNSPVFNKYFYYDRMRERKGIAEMSIIEITKYLTKRISWKIKSLRYIGLS